MCPDLSSAKEQAAIARERSRTVYKSVKEALKTTESCNSVHVAFEPRREEKAIRPFTAWVIAFDENGPHRIANPAEGKDARIPVTLRRERVRYYFGNFVTAGGQKGSGWAQIPDRPYILDYLDYQKKKGTRK